MQVYSLRKILRITSLSFLLTDDKVSYDHVSEVSKYDSTTERSGQNHSAAAAAVGCGSDLMQI